jgi:hypothetical protein
LPITKKPRRRVDFISPNREQNLKQTMKNKAEHAKVISNEKRVPSPAATEFVSFCPQQCVGNPHCPESGSLIACGH